MGSAKGVKKRPTTEREKLYRIVLDLRKEGLSYNRIIEKVEVETGVTLRKSHISGWINGKHRPFGYVTGSDAAPTAELAYVIGVYLGDASSSTGRRNYNHMVKLRVIDEEFAEEFARCLGVLLHRVPPRAKWHQKTSSWHTQVSSLLLQNFLKQELSALVPAITHCDDCKAAFLRGFFDSEGGISGRMLSVKRRQSATLFSVRTPGVNWNRNNWSAFVENGGRYGRHQRQALPTKLRPDVCLRSVALIENFSGSSWFYRYEKGCRFGRRVEK